MLNFIPLLENREGKHLLLLLDFEECCGPFDILWWDFEETEFFKDELSLVFIVSEVGPFDFTTVGRLEDFGLGLKSDGSNLSKGKKHIKIYHAAQ